MTVQQALLFPLTTRPVATNPPDLTGVGASCEPHPTVVPTEKIRGQQRTILDVLMSRPGRIIDHEVFRRMGIKQCPTRVFELRAKGHRISSHCIDHERGVWGYRYDGPAETETP